MYLTNDDFEQFVFCAEMLRFSPLYENMHPKTKAKVNDALLTIEKLKLKKAKDVKRQTEYMNKKRKDDRFYGRGKAFREKYERKNDL